MNNDILLTLDTLDNDSFMLYDEADAYLYNDEQEEHDNERY